MKTNFAGRTAFLMLFALCGILAGGCRAHPHSEYRTIHEYAKNGDINGVKAVLEQSPADVNLPEDDGQTPLHLAAENCHVDVVTLLLNKGAKINAPGSDNETPLHLAAQEGCAEAVKVLVAKGADTNAKDKQGRTPLERAKQWNQTNIVTLLSP